MVATTSFDTETTRKNARTGILTMLGAVAMLGLGYAAVPLYDLFCRVTGYGGTTAQGTGSDTVLDQTIAVRFDASQHRNMMWEFTAPDPRVVELQIGQTGLAFYEAHNPTDQPILGTASYNVAPYEAGGFFDKIDCFCFEQQILQPGETISMPVTFFVDPAIVDDREGQYIHTITLGYTFHRNDMPVEYDNAALDVTDPSAPVTDTN